MTTQQIMLIQQSFERLRPIAQQAGELFYQNLFELAPQVRVMFKTPVAEQAGKLMYTLAYMVNHLHTPETILDDVRKLAIRHIEYGATPEHYHVVGAALLKTLEQGLGEHWNHALKEAWSMAYTMIAEAMIEATTRIDRKAA
jgi:hemoglobin-like flavoprotein